MVMRLVCFNDEHMRLHILSDLHIEFDDFTPSATNADIVVLAGDIGVGTGGLEWACEHFPESPLVYVPGNHEFYDHDLQIVDTLKANAPANIHVLNDEQVEFGGVRFLGSVLWTDFELFGKGKTYFSMQRARDLMEDFSSIRNDDHVFTPEDSITLHQISKAWLRARLAESFGGRTVVVTHHLPSLRSVAPRYASDLLTPAFASNLESMIDTGRPALWIHGHTHDAFDYEIYDTRIICNPRGYAYESSNSGFAADLVVEI